MPSVPRGEPLRMEAQTAREPAGNAALKVTDQTARPSRAWDCNDEADGVPELLDQRRPFELRRAQLGLQVDERTFDFDLDRLVGTAEDEIGSAAVLRTYGLLDAGVPRWMGVGHDRLNGLDLPAVPESDAVRWIKPEAELVAGRRSERAGGRPVNPPGRAFGPAHHRLADIGESRQLRLGQTGGGAGAAQL